jgi:hypothetical protein
MVLKWYIEIVKPEEKATIGELLEAVFSLRSVPTTIGKLSANRRLVGRVFFGVRSEATNQQAATDATVGYAVFSLGSDNRLYKT